MSIQTEVLNNTLLSLLENQEIAERLCVCKSPEECYAVVKEYIPDIAFAEFLESMTFIRTHLEVRKNGLLDMDDLESVAGGVRGSSITLGLGVGVAAASAAAI